jgi:hypothetical protein
MNGSWYQVHPSEVITIASRFPDVRLRMIFNWILTNYLSVEGLPDDDEEIAYLTGLSIEDVTAMRPYWKRLGRIENGRIYINYAEEVIADKQMYVEQKSSAANARWKNAQDGPKKKTPKPPTDSSAEQRNATHSNADPNPTPHKNEKPKPPAIETKDLPSTSDATHSDAQQRNAKLCHKDIHTYIQEEGTARAREENSVLAKIEAIEQAVISEYGYTIIEPFLERQIKSVVGKCNAAGFDAAAIREYVSSRSKPPSLNFLCQEMQTWRASRDKQGQAQVIPMTPKKTFCGKCNYGYLPSLPGENRARICPCNLPKEAAAS